MKLVVYIFLKILNFRIKVLEFYEIKNWSKIYDFSEPFPSFIKKKVLRDYSSSSTIWIETGTLVGDTAKYLSSISKFVYTVEPSVKYYNLSKKILSNYDNIKIYNDTSENILKDILEKLPNGSEICFWLDGHWSGGDTFKGDTDTPILSELEVIEKFLNKFFRINILIDDFRLFDFSEDIATYPSKNLLIEFALKNDLNWRVTRDIFILSRPS